MTSEPFHILLMQRVLKSRQKEREIGGQIRYI